MRMAECPIRPAPGDQMSWLDDVPVGNDDQNPYDPNQPIEREFVLAPAWRAFKANLSALFKRSEPRQEEEHAAVAEPMLTSRISEPEPIASVVEAPQVESHTTYIEEEPQFIAPVAHYEPAMEETLAPEPMVEEIHAPVAEEIWEPEPAIAAPTEAEPVIQQQAVEPAELEPTPILETETASFAESIPEPEIDSTRYEAHIEEPRKIHATDHDEDAAIAATASGSPIVEAAPAPTVAHATSAAVLANARGESKLVAAAVAVESWADSLKTRFASWKASRKEQRAQRELFAVPVSKRSERDRVWMQTTVAAAAIALAFLMGWIAANSRRPATTTNEEAITAPAESPVISTRGASAASATPAATKPAGVTLQAGGATVQAGGVTLSPSSSVSEPLPPSTAAAAAPTKPSPAKPARHSHTASRGHLRRSIDSGDDEVVVHHYAPKPSPIVSAQKQTAQVKQYSDNN